MRGRFGWAVAGFVLVIAATSGAASNSAIRDCRQACKADYQDAITDPSECFNCASVTCDPTCDSQLSDAIDGQDSCLACLAGDCSDIPPPNDQSFFTTCTNQCASPKPGVCALNLTCVRTCREQLFFHQQRCRQRFQNQVRSVCRQVACGSDVNYFRTAKKQLRQCRRACKTNPAAAVARVARAAPQVETARAVPLETAPPTGCGCQQQCIRRIAGNCYSQCQNACRGDQDALNLCQRACRNAQCASLRSACASDAANPASSYAACCSQCLDSSGVSCSDSDQTAEEICTPTTSTTTTTTTSTSTSSTGPTTTTFAGQTTTTTTTTFAGQTTTTTLVPR